MMALVDQQSASAVHELTTRLSIQIRAADDEIDETRAILRDAIQRLMPSFVDASIASFTQNQASAFSALQFQDISDQQLAHAQARLRALRVQLLRFQAAFDNSAVTAHDDGRGQGITFIGLVNEANDALASLDLRLEKPVATPHLGTGGVEFF